MAGFTPSIKRLGNSEQDQLRLGVARAKEGRLDEALSAFETAAQINPESVPAHMAAGNLLFRQRRYDEALLHYQSVMKLDPLIAIAPLKAGSICLRQQNLDSALNFFENALNLDPQSTNATFAYVGMGQVYLKREQYDAAVQQFRKALRLNPQMMMGRMMLASAYKRQGQLDAAIAELEAVQAADTQIPSSYLQLGSIYLEQRNYGKAKAAFQAALKLDPKIPLIKTSIKFGLAEALIQENELQEAAKILRVLPETKLYAPKKHQLFGDLYSRQGLSKEAAEEYRAAALLGSSGGMVPDELANLEELENQESWDDLVESYRLSANAVLQGARS
ncbi:MAG: tetratricopeptide repeat protein [Cyanobacteriota bacterium]|nr:tetratricopeptide repeat protein [Cyanobacteriota bacterium]